MFKNMKIAQKLIVSFCAVVVIASVSGIVGLSLLTTTVKDYNSALVANGFVLGDIGDYNTYINQGGALVRDVIMLTDEAEIKAAQEELEIVKKKTQDALNAADVNCQTDAEQEVMAHINATSPKYKEARDRAVELGLQNKNEEALRVFREEAMPYLNECVAGGQKLMEMNVQMGNDTSARLAEQSTAGIMIIICVIAGAAALAIGIAVFVSRSISRPVKACAERLVLLSEGDLHTDVPHSSSRDEVGVMLKALESTTSSVSTIISDVGRGLGEIAGGNLDIDSTADFKGDFNQIKISIDTIVGSLNETLGQINVSADQVSSGSEQVSSGAQALSQGATEQASSVEELAASITEVSQQVKDNADNAQDASVKSARAGSEVTQSNKKMQELIEAMAQISSSSQEIGKVIKTIEDIAFQTNILALNAAVEAARAGAAGKGFAVVADEVRNLASKSAEAAKGTTALIEGAVAAVENGTKLADDTAKSLISVVDGAREVNEIVDRISYASKEQANAIDQITTGIDQISSVVQTNSATAEESAAASEELSSQAAMLKSLVGRFNLKAGY